MLKHEIFLCMLGSTLLHALMLFCLTPATAVPQIPMIAMETFIITPPSDADQGFRQSRHPAADVLPGRRALKEHQSAANQKRDGSRAGTGHEIQPDTHRNNKIPALEQGPTVSIPAEINPPMNTAAGKSVPSHFPSERGGDGSTAIAKVGTEAPGVMSLGDAGAPRFIHRELPRYPFLARKLGKEGRVVLRLTLDEKGGQKNIEIIEKDGYGFTEAAVQAIKNSILTPAQKDGKSVVSRVLIPVRFVLKED